MTTVIYYLASNIMEIDQETALLIRALALSKIKLEHITLEGDPKGGYLDLSDREYKDHFAVLPYTHYFVSIGKRWSFVRLACFYDPKYPDNVIEFRVQFFSQMGRTDRCHIRMNDRSSQIGLQMPKEVYREIPLNLRQIFQITVL